MTNAEILARWNRCSYRNIRKFDLSNFYSSMFIQEDNDAEDLLCLFGITTEQLIKTENEYVNFLLEKIDGLMLESSFIMREFIVDYVFQDNTNEDDLMFGCQSSKEELTEIYRRVKLALETIKKQLDTE